MPKWSLSEKRPRITTINYHLEFNGIDKKGFRHKNSTAIIQAYDLKEATEALDTAIEHLIVTDTEIGPHDTQLDLKLLNCDAKIEREIA